MKKLIGHHRQKEMLEAAARGGHLHHAQLFMGPKGLGKTTLALELTLTLQSEDLAFAEEGQILNPYQKQILNGADPDTLLFLDKGENLPIKEVRKMIERLGQSHNRPHLVVVIENLGRMKVEALNAILKTLEEPHPGVQFFLTANRDEDVLPTILSRCQVTRFQSVGKEALHEVAQLHLEELLVNAKARAKERLEGLTEAQIEQAIDFAMGRPGKLFRLLEEWDYFEAHIEMQNAMESFVRMPQASRAFAITRDYEKSELRQELLDILLHHVRTCALENRGERDWTDALEKIEQAKLDLSQNVNVRLTLETLLLSFGD
jgi:DNA polymerase-3 subunit delta'